MRRELVRLRIRPWEEDEADFPLEEETVEDEAEVEVETEVSYPS